MKSCLVDVSETIADASEIVSQNLVKEGSSTGEDRISPLMISALSRGGKLRY